MIRLEVCNVFVSKWCPFKFPPGSQVSFRMSGFITSIRFFPKPWFPNCSPVDVVVVVWVLASPFYCFPVSLRYPVSSPISGLLTVGPIPFPQLSPVSTLLISLQDGCHKTEAHSSGHALCPADKALHKIAKLTIGISLL